MLTARLYEMHDRSRFEIVAFSSGPDTGDAMRRRLASAFDRFLDVQGESDLAVARRAREMEIDIAIDLGGFTQGSRPGVLALRAAPVQAGFLGYLGTMGAEYIDYLIADRTLIPEASRAHYSERIVDLPSYQPNDATRPVADRHFTRGELGLPPSGFVFCCFNNSYKITPEVFDSWMRILQGVEGSVLFLYAGDPHVEPNLRREAAARGVDSGRLIFGERLPAQEYLARYRAADLALDTFPYNAGTTASDALWAGVPLVTLAGESLAGRVAASVLHAVGLPELVTTTREEYEALAVGLATDPEQLAGVRRKLDRNRPMAPLFDSALFARRLETAYTLMYERHHAGERPAHIDVPG